MSERSTRQQPVPLRDSASDKRGSVSKVDASIVRSCNDAADLSDECKAHFLVGIKKDLIIVGKPLCLGGLLQMDDSLQGVGQALGTHGLERIVLPIGVFWRGRLGEIAPVFVNELTDRAKRIFGKPEEDP